MNKERVSIKDIADVAGVSHPTVSRALNDSPLISDDTRTRIQRLALEMGYTPDAVAQSLQKRRTHIIGLVVTSIGDPFYADLARGVEEAARSAGFNVFLNSSHNDPDLEIHVIETFHRQRVDGILAASSRIGDLHLERLGRINVPVVLINNQAEENHDFLHSIAVDSRAGARAATGHLLELGHRRIAYIGVRNRPRSNAQRLAGYLEALADAGEARDDDMVRIMDMDPGDDDSDVQGGHAAATTLLDTDATALLCYNDMVAVGALMACRERGRSVPDEMSVVGFDDIDLARYVDPPLTSVTQPRRQMGRSAMTMLIRLLDDHSVEDRVIEPAVTIRRSTSPPPASSRST